LGCRNKPLGKAFGFDWAWFGIVVHWVGLELLVFFELDLALAVGVFCIFKYCLGGNSY
jgi:hypothetical protein